MEGQESSWRPSWANSSRQRGQWIDDIYDKDVGGEDDEVHQQADTHEVTETVAYKQIDIARTSVTSARENLRLQRIFYGAGTTTMTDLLDAVTLFTQSESQLVTACATYQERVAEYRRKTDMD